MDNRLSKEERAERLKWQAEDDARIMAVYQEIISDKSRMNRAVKEANRQANDLQKRANTMKKVGRRNGK